jgi:hypothetical protein
MKADVPTLPEYLEFMIADDENEEMSPYNPKWGVKKKDSSNKHNLRGYYEVCAGLPTSLGSVRDAHF